MANSVPKEVIVELLSEFVRSTEIYGTHLVPVIRGSFLLQHWFGKQARPVADLDLECFVRSSTRHERSDDESPGQTGEIYTLADLGMTVCHISVQSLYQQGRSPYGIAFHEADEHDAAMNLWTYGTPGQRYIVGWTWHTSESPGGLFRSPRVTELEGTLQIDIAAAGDYHLDEISWSPLTLKPNLGRQFICPAYTQEMMLAAKLSWLIRGLSIDPWQSTGTGLLMNCEPKDLFDAHLLVTQGTLRPQEFQKGLLAVCRESDLDHSDLDRLFAVRQLAVNDRDFPQWPAFASEHLNLLTNTPANMLRTIAERIEPLLGDFHCPEERAFLKAIKSDHTDEASYLIYADWLEERDVPRSRFLRMFVNAYFHERRLAPEEAQRLRQALSESLRSTSQPWLLQLLGAQRLREIRERWGTANP